MSVICAPPVPVPAPARKRYQRIKRTGIVLVAATASLVIGAGTALAHVEVTPDTVAPGSFSILTFHVPNESATATTVQLQIQLPADAPFASVRARQTAGWQAQLTTTKLPAVITSGTVTLDEAVTKVTFTTDAGTEGIGLGQFAEFDLQVGPVPLVDAISFIVLQTYSDGTVVSWSEPTPPGGEEPEHPAPVLTVAGEVTDDHGHSAAASTDAGTAMTMTSAADPSSQAAIGSTAAATRDGGARTLGVIGIVVGVLGLGVGGLALANGAAARRHRRSDPE